MALCGFRLLCPLIVNEAEKKLLRRHLVEPLADRGAHLLVGGQHRQRAGLAWGVRSPYVEALQVVCKRPAWGVRSPYVGARVQLCVSWFFSKVIRPMITSPTRDPHCNLVTRPTLRIPFLFEGRWIYSWNTRCYVGARLWKATFLSRKFRDAGKGPSDFQANTSSSWLSTHRAPLRVWVVFAWRLRELVSASLFTL